MSQIEGERLDKTISFSGIISRSQLKLRMAYANINGKRASLSHKIKLHDKIEIFIKEERSFNFEAEEMDLDVIFENEDTIVLNKREKLVVHPGAGNWTNTILNGVLGRINIMEFTGRERAGIVHRLDKDTSGVLIIAKNLRTLGFLQKQFKERSVHKTYIAIANGILTQKSGRIEGLIKRDERNRKSFTISTAGKYSATDYQVISEFGNLSAIKLNPSTGRTHQLRVHLKSIGHPIVGDKIYGKNEGDHLMLHAYSLFIKIKEGENSKKFIAQMPHYIYDMLGENAKQIERILQN